MVKSKRLTMKMLGVGMIEITGASLKEVRKTLWHIAAVSVTVGFSIGLIGFMWNLSPVIAVLLK